ncbi:hypothetical protein TWF696_007477 [Orbilia brochopaga]|uniref:F-box domain-containing protein n=1 Tax=Orbilia brochopaga TaxID=3140254 RepID=A0AAV9UP06_9PEZI
MSAQADGFLSLPLDIHILIIRHLSSSDILKLRVVSKSSYALFTSPTICRSYLSNHGIFPESLSTARHEFDRCFIPRSRTANGHPTKAFAVDGVRLNEDDAPYFTKSHVFTAGGQGQGVSGAGYETASNSSRDGIAIYRTTNGDLAFLHLSDSSKSSVLLLSESWEFTTQSLMAYNQDGGKAATGSDGKAKGKGRAMARWSLGGSKSKNVEMKMQLFDINVHDDFGGEVALIELSWGYNELNREFDQDPNRQVSTQWHGIINHKVNLGIVVSVASRNLGHPIAAFALPRNHWPWSEYVLNKHYVAGICCSKREFMFLRYARENMDTVCSLRSALAEDGQGETWSLLEYLAPVVSISLGSMGLVDFCHRLNYDGSNSYINMDVHLQTDRAGELVFIITGAGVTAFNVDGVSRYSGPTVARTYWWRQKDMVIYLPAREASATLSSREQRSQWERAEQTGGETRIIGPSFPRIWKSYLPGKTFGGGVDDHEMFTIVRGYNYTSDTFLASVDEATGEFQPWQRPQFLVAWEIPVTRRGVEYYTPELLNERLGNIISDASASLPTNNPEGIFHSKIMELSNNGTDGWDVAISEPHTVLASNTLKMCFAKRDAHKTKPSWLAIIKGEAVVQRDEYFTIAWPPARERFTMKIMESGIFAVQRQPKTRDVLRVDWSTNVRCDRPYPRPAEKRSSGILGIFSPGNSKVPAYSEVLASDTEALPIGDIHHVKVGESGEFFAYVVNTSAMPGQGSGQHPCGGYRGGTLAVLRYD